MFSSFLPSDVDTSLQLQLFEENKAYNLDICDIFFLALFNCFNVKIVVVEKGNAGIDKIKCFVEPNCPVDESSCRRTFYLVKTFDHYDPLLRHGECNF